MTQVVWGIPYVVTLWHLFAMSHHVQRSEFRKKTFVKSRTQEHCTQNKRGIDESPTKYGTQTRAISGKWRRNKCLMASTQHIRVWQEKPITVFCFNQTTFIPVWLRSRSYIHQKKIHDSWEKIAAWQMWKHERCRDLWVLNMSLKDTGRWCRRNGIKPSDWFTLNHFENGKFVPPQLYHFHNCI